MDAEAPAASPSKLSNSQQDCEEHNKSVLKAKLNKLAEQIGKIALFCAVVTMIILYIRLMYKGNILAIIIEKNITIYLINHSFIKPRYRIIFSVFSDKKQEQIKEEQMDKFGACYEGGWQNETQGLPTEMWALEPDTTCEARV